MARRFEAESVYLASVHPGQLPPIKLPVGTDPSENAPRSTTYTMKPRKRGSRPPFALVKVTDAFENILDVPASSEAKRKVWNSKLVPCERIAEQLLKDWATGVIDANGETPGVIQIAGEIPTQAEIKRMLDMESRYAEQRFQYGERMYREHHTEQIPDECRLMAEWLGRKVIWAQPELSGQTKECTACFELIDSRATVCSKCGSQQAVLTPPEPMVEAPEQVTA